LKTARLALLSVMLGATNCQSGTFVVLTFEAGAATPAGIVSIDLAVTLGGQTATTSFSKGGGPIAFPSTAALQIQSGTGAIQVQAIARGANNEQLDTGFGIGTVVSGARTDVRVRFGRLAVDLPALDFGAEPIGTSSVRTITVTNHAGDPIGPLTTAVDGDFAIRADACSTKTLAPADACTVDIAFMPTAAGPRAGSFSVKSGDDAAFSVLSGVGQPSVTLTVNLTGPGAGTVVSSLDGLSCSATTCSISLPLDETMPQMVTFTPRPDYRSQVIGWSDGCSGTADCVLAADADHTVTLAFGLRPPSLTMRIVGNGKVVSDDGQINCGSGGTACGPVTYPLGNQVTLVAAPTGSAQFIGWGGGTSTCPPAAKGGCKMEACANVICAPGEECQSGFCVTATPLCSSLTCPGTSRCEAGKCIGQSVGCSGPKDSCTMEVPPDLVLTATFGASADYMFTTSATFGVGALGGVSGLDMKCQQASSAMYLPGMYKAWVSTTTAAANTRVGSGGWYRTDGRVFAPNLAQLTGSSTGNYKIFYPPRLDEMGNDFGMTAQVIATGTGGNGTVNINNCNDFMSATAAVQAGITTGVDNLWTEGVQFAEPCGAQHHIYCMRVDGTSGTLSLPTPVARRAFLSSGTYDPSTGIGGADALCSANAQAAGLTTTTGFVAFMATPTASAASRLDLSPGTLPYAMVDGTLIVERPFDLIVNGGLILTPINLVADGSGRIPRVVWTGATDPTAVGTMASTCNGWTNKTSGAMARQGFEREASSQWFSDVDAPCSFSAGAVLCFER
jgi:hypothetical protein